MQDIIKRINPTVIAFCETKMDTSSRLIKKVFKDYEVILQHVKKGKGGLALVVNGNVCRKPLNVTSTLDKNILVVRMEIGSSPVRIILGYAPQENDEREEREEFFTEMSIEIEKCVSAAEYPLIIGDLNAKLEKQSETITPMTPNGKLL